VKVVLTHAQGRLEELEAALRRRGDEVVRIPLIEVRPRTDAATRAEARRLVALPWLLFPSRSAVEAWTALGLPLPESPHGPQLGAVGAATASALKRIGGRVDVIGDPPTAEGLARTFLARRDARGPVGLPRGDRARPTLERALRDAGLTTRALTLYETTRRPWRSDAPPDAVVVASPSAVEGLPDDVDEAAALVAIGPTTAAALRARGLRPWIAERPDASAILARLDDARRAGSDRGGDRDSSDHGSDRARSDRTAADDLGRTS